MAIGNNKWVSDGGYGSVVSPLNMPLYARVNTAPQNVIFGYLWQNVAPMVGWRVNALFSVSHPCLPVYTRKMNPESLTSVSVPNAHCGICLIIEQDS